MLPAHKPDSVVSPESKTPSFIWPEHYCSDLAAYPPTLPASRQTSNGPFSALVYVALQHARFTRPANCLTEPWALTPRFHFYPPRRCRNNPPIAAGLAHFRGFRQLFSVALSVPMDECFHSGWSRRLTGALPCTVRTFLGEFKRHDGTAGSPTKLVNFFKGHPEWSRIGPTDI
jgi:hypothetical protein